jgi:hypothetical protein
MAAMCAGVILLSSCVSRGPMDMAGKPKIVKLGTIDCGIVESNPIVFNDKVYRFEYIRQNYWGNKTGSSYFHFIDHQTGKATPPFGQGYHLGTAFVDGDTVYVSCSSNWGGDKIQIFASKDMEHWDAWTALNLPGFGIYNSSICKAGDKYVLMFEIDKPEDRAGLGFTAQFAESTDLHTWTLLPPECNYARDRYTAPHCLRYLDGYYYNFYLEAFSNPTHYHQYVVRSPDLIVWEQSPLNPVLMPGPADKVIFNKSLTAEQRAKVAEALDNNNSDIDFCEYHGRLIINYSWGNQQGNEYLAEAYYDGTLEQFLKGWFPR